MRICLFDDSIEYDAHRPEAFPLGGAEKAFASLPGALARRGHDVQVFNRCRYATYIEDARWTPWEQTRPLDADVVIAFRRPSLLTEVRAAKSRILWVTAHPAYLENPANARLIDSTGAKLAFVNRTQQALYRGRHASAVVEPGLRAVYLNEAGRFPAEAPVAVVTTHPKHGLEWLVDLWVEQIRPQVPTARLHVYSSVLSRGKGGKPVPKEYQVLSDKLASAKTAGVHVEAPSGDANMSLAYRSARVHLYPGHPDDMGCWTLAETQACGVPAVCRPLGAVAERVSNGQTGYIVPDDEAFANVAVQILGDDGVFKGLSEAARSAARRQTWDRAAETFEALWT